MKKGKIGKKISEKENLAEIIQKYPQAGKILTKAGLHCLGCAAVNFDTLEDAMKIHGLSEKEIKEIVEKINESI